MKIFTKVLPAICIVLVTLFACRNPNEYPNLHDYNLNNPVVIHLKTELDEISGVVYYPKDTSVFVINDELGLLYKIYLRKKIQIEQWEFSKDADYEDLVLIDSTFYALNSNGNLTRFRIYAPDSIDVQKYKIDLKGKNEFESIYYDSISNKLVLICKDCKGDKDLSTAYGFNLTQLHFEKEPHYTLDAKAVITKAKEGGKKFKPSAAAIHPISGELFIISSVNKCLVVANQQGKIQQVYPLNPKIFKQPEGITFTPTGDMLISNEAADIGAGNILIFKYKPQE